MSRKTATLRFDCDEDLEGFLMSNERGRGILRRVIDKEMPYFLASSMGEEWLGKIEEAIKHPKVLIVIYGDGYSEVHATSHVTVEVAKVPMTSWKTMEPMKIEEMEEAAKQSLHKSWVKLWNKNKVRAIFNSLPLKPTEFLKRELSKRVISALRMVEEVTSSITQDSEGAHSAEEGCKCSSTQAKICSGSGTHAK